MAIDFGMERWDKVRETYRRWWAGDLERPLIQLALEGRDPGRREPKLPHYPFTAHHAPSVTAEAIVDRWTTSCRGIPGRRVPPISATLAPAHGGLYGGECPPRRTGRVSARDEHDIRDLRSITFRTTRAHRVKDIWRAAMDRWRGRYRSA